MLLTFALYVMKTLDIVYDFSEPASLKRGGLCRVRLFVHNSHTAVLITNLDDVNDGQSVTNAIENIIGSIKDEGYAPTQSTFIEHYEKHPSSCDTFDKVELSGRVQWIPLNRGDVLSLIGEESQELDDRSSKNQRVYRKADKIRRKRDPFIDSLCTPSNEFVRRKLEIEHHMVAKSELNTLIEQGAGEQELQKVIKKDLSLFGEAYSLPHDEYICFSEYPLAGGAIDFVTFTGRSRMDVVFVEVKGANFNLLNCNHYESFNHNISDALTQINARLRAVYEDLGRFRADAHARRSRAEHGEHLYNSFLGARVPLQVDPHKDVNIRSVVIGGRTVDDVRESHARQAYEAHAMPPVRVESWDTWLRRLQRR